MNLAIAIALAAEGFKNKFDKAGEPYILHCLRVMERMDTEEEKIVAVLHDTVEDGVCTIEDLEKIGFSKNIVYSIHLLTHKEECTYSEYIRMISTDKVATKVKLSDLRDNSDITRLKGLTKKDFDRIEKYHTSFIYLSKV